MKKILFLSLSALLTFACQSPEEQKEELKTSIYTLYRANYNPTSGEVKVTELSPGVLEVSIKLKNTDKENDHPAHLHFGTVREVGELAFSLNPVNGATGESVTILDKVVLSNGDLLTYDAFLQLDGSVKVHMDDNYFKHMVLAFGNVGKNEEYFFDGVAVCTGH